MNEYLLKHLIELMRINRDNFIEDNKIISPVTFFYEFCTLQLGLPRRSGKTTSICATANPGDTIINPLHSANGRDYASTAGEVMCASEFIKKFEDGYSSTDSIVFIDEPWVLPKGALEGIQNIVSKSGSTNLIVMLGTVI